MFSSSVNSTGLLYAYFHPSKQENDGNSKEIFPAGRLFLRGSLIGSTDLPHRFESSFEYDVCARNSRAYEVHTETLQNIQSSPVAGCI